MNGDPWGRVAALFHGALAEPPADRDAWLDAACDGDPVLRAEVSSLLAADQAAGEAESDFLAATIVGGMAGMAGIGNIGGEAPAPRRAGPYRIERELGRGGMGAVYLAVRKDDPDRRPVAVKLLAGFGLPGVDLRRRFAVERRVLARLDHPNVARFHDAGVTEDGIPYVAMEAVLGEPIDVWCDRRRLSISARLALFRTVCAAVSAVHASLVVHRDLKPGNILVTADGTVKLLDFGIAKLLDSDGAESDPTRTASRLLTPAYASPEQIRGEPVTTASDVYSLGVLLAELLTGRRPATAPGVDATRPSATVAALEPAAGRAVAAARGTSPAELSRRLRGDLDVIVQKALREASERRYGSAEQLAEDLRRHAAALPIAARPDTLTYRAGKFLRRNRTAVGVGLAFVLLLVGFLAVLEVQAARTARERDKAERALAFLVDLFAVSDPGEARGRDLSAREILDRGAARVDRELRGQPEVRAALSAALGRVYGRLGLYDRAEPLLQTALALRRKTQGPKSADVAESWSRLGDLWQAEGKYDRAEAAYRQALSLRAKLFGESSPAVAESLDSLADLLADQGDFGAALPLLRRALALRERLFGAESREAAASRNSLALFLHERGDLAAAEPLYRRALETRRRLLGTDHPEVAASLNNLAALLQAKGDLQGAEPLLRQALAIDRRVLGPHHPEIAVNLKNLAMLLNARGTPKAALPLIEEALAIERRAIGPTSPDLATTLHDRGILQAAAGDPAAAEGSYRAALDLYRQKLPAGHPYIAHPLVALGRLFLERGDAKAARPLLEEALAIRRRGLPAGHWRTGEAAGLLGACLASRGELAAARPLLEESHRILAAALGEGSGAAREARDRLVRLPSPLKTSEDH